MDILKAADELKKALEGDSKLSPLTIIGVCKRMEEALKFLKAQNLVEANKEFTKLCHESPGEKVFLLDGATVKRASISTSYIYSKKVAKLADKVVEAQEKLKARQAKEKADGTAKVVPGKFDPKKNSAFAVSAVKEKYPTQLQGATA